jgi:hypothetical protein
LKKIVKKCLKAGINCPFPLTFTNDNENKCKGSVKMDSEHRHSDTIRYSNGYDLNVVIPFANEINRRCK